MVRESEKRTGTNFEHKMPIPHKELLFGTTKQVRNARTNVQVNIKDKHKRRRTSSKDTKNISETVYEIFI